jgi:excisionase family DNA binding protein
MPTVPRIALEKGDRWLDATEVSLIFGVDRETVCRWARAGDLPSYMPSRKRFFKRSEVNILLSKKNLPTI